MDFLEQIKKAKEDNIEFKSAEDTELLKNREYASKAAFLLTNLLIARENIYRECRFSEDAVRSLKEPTEKMKYELRFIAAVCEELLKE